MNDPYYRQRIQKSKISRRRREKVRPLSQQIQEASQMLLAAIAILFVGSTMGFLYTSSLQSAKGYELQQLQQDHEELLVANRRLQGKVDTAKSLNQLEETEITASMESNQSEDNTYVGEEGDLASAN